MSDQDLNKDFNFNLSRIRSGGTDAIKADTQCMNILRDMYKNPTYNLGEFQPMLNSNVNSYCKATGKSYELVMTEMSMTKIKF